MIVNEDVTNISVLIVDDDPLVLSSLRHYFAAAENISVVAEACDGEEALMLLNNVAANVVLADIHMPTMDGVSLLREIQRLPNPPAFIAITALDNDETMLKVLAGGGAGYIVKSARPQAIITAVRDAVSGGTTVSPKALNRLIDYIPDKVIPPLSRDLEASSIYNKLTPVEKGVLEHLCLGMSNADIATAMQYSEATVKKYVSNLISHFDVTSRLSLVISAIQIKAQK